MGRNIAHPGTHRPQGLVPNTTRKMRKKEEVKKKEWRKDFFFSNLAQGASVLRGPGGTYFNAAPRLLVSTGLGDCMPHYPLQNEKLNNEQK